MLSTSVTSKNIQQVHGSIRKYSDTCSEYFDNLDNSESGSVVRSADMRKPEDLQEFSLETGTSSGRNFTSLNKLKRNQKVIIEIFEMKKLIS